jgi:hypothetical protein
VYLGARAARSEIGLVVASENTQGLEGSAPPLDARRQDVPAARRAHPGARRFRALPSPLRSRADGRSAIENVAEQARLQLAEFPTVACCASCVRRRVPQRNNLCQRLRSARRRA